MFTSGGKGRWCLEDQKRETVVFLGGCILFGQGEVVEQNQKGFLACKMLVCPCRSLGGKRRAAGVPGQGVELRLQVGNLGLCCCGTGPPRRKVSCGQHRKAWSETCS